MEADPNPADPTGTFLMNGTRVFRQVPDLFYTVHHLFKNQLTVEKNLFHALTPPPTSLHPEHHIAIIH